MVADLEKAMREAMDALDQCGVPKRNRTVWVPETLFSLYPGRYIRAARKLNLELGVVPDGGSPRDTIFYINTEEDYW